MKIIIFAMLIFLSCLSCTHNHIIRQNDPNDYNLFNKLTKNYRAEVFMTSGRIYSSDKLYLDSDTTVWINPSTEKVVMVPTKDICKIRFKRPGIGAAEGVGIGAASGAVVGFVFGYIFGYSTEDSEYELFHEAEDRAKAGSVIFGLYGTLIGAGIGTAVGTVRGSREDFIIKFLE